MKQQLNEIKRMQKLAGILTEADMGSHLQVGDVIKKLTNNTSVTVKRIDGDKVFVVSADMPDHEFMWTADGIDDEIKRGRLKVLAQNESRLSEDVEPKIFVADYSDEHGDKWEAYFKDEATFKKRQDEVESFIRKYSEEIYGPKGEEVDRAEHEIQFTDEEEEILNNGGFLVNTYDGLKKFK